MRQGLIIPGADEKNTKGIPQAMMFGWGSSFLLPSYKWEERIKGLAGRIMKSLTTFTIPNKDNLDLRRIKINNKRQVEKIFLDQLFKFLYRDRFDFVYDWKSEKWLAIFEKNDLVHYRAKNTQTSKWIFVCKKCWLSFSKIEGYKYGGNGKDNKIKEI